MKNKLYCKRSQCNGYVIFQVIYAVVRIYVTRFAKTSLVRTKWQDKLFTTNQLLHQWTNNTCVYYFQWFTSLLFLRLFSRACLTCSSARVAFKWQWCEWTSIHLAGNHHMTGQKAWLSNWLLFVISRAQIGLRWHLWQCYPLRMEKPTTPNFHPNSYVYQCFGELGYYKEKSKRIFK